MGTAAGPLRRIVGSSASFEPEERLDVLVHALAQAPAATTLDLWGDGPDRSRLEAIARAYDLEDRVRFLGAEPFGHSGVRGAHPSEPSVGDGAIAVYPSARSLAAALLRPGDGPGLVVGADPPEGSGLERTTFAGLVEALWGPGDLPGAPAAGEGNADLAGARVAILTNIPAHYRVPLFETLAARLEAAGAHLRVLFLARTYRRRAWMRPGELRFDHVFLHSVGVPVSPARRLFLSLDLERALRAYAPTLVVAGSLSPLVAGRAVRFGRRHGIPVGLWSGATARSAAREPGIGERGRRRLLAGAGFGAAYGVEAADYLASLDPGLPVAIVRNAAPIPAPRARTTEPGGPLEVLTIADLSTPGKDVDLLIRALAARPSLPARLTVAGGGPGLEALRSLAAPLGDRVRLLGPVPSDRIHEEYARAGAFAFPSGVDVFGLVLLEAMGAGLPTATSDRPGAASDLCVDGHNAIVVREATPDGWATAFERLARDPGERARLGTAAAATVARRWTLSHSVEAWLAAFRLGLGRG